MHGVMHDGYSPSYRSAVHYLASQLFMHDISQYVMHDGYSPLVQKRHAISCLCMNTFKICMALLYQGAISIMHDAVHELSLTALTSGGE